MVRPVEHTIEHLARNTSHVLLDNGVMSRAYNYRDLYDKIEVRKDFCKYLSPKRNVDQLDLDLLNPQFKHSSDLSFLIHCLDNITMVDSTLGEYSRFVSHLIHMKRDFRRNLKRLKRKLNGDTKQKAKTFFSICDEYNSIYDCLSRRVLSTSFSEDSSFNVIKKHMEEKKLHLPRGRKFRKKNGRTDISEADLGLVATAYDLALEFGEGVVIISTDMDVINLVYNFGADYNLGRINGELNSQNLKQRVSVYYPSAEGWMENLNCMFKANSEGLTYGALRGPFY